MHHLLRSIPILFLFAITIPRGGNAGEILHPADLEFKRVAAKRMVFDSDQAIPLSLLRPATVRDFDLMHPELLTESDSSAGSDWSIHEGQLVGESADSKMRSMRWVGGFNAYATYDLQMEDCKGSGAAGIGFRSSSKGDLLVAKLHFEEGTATEVSWGVELDGETVVRETYPIPENLPAGGVTLRVQMAVVGVNLLLESAGQSQLVGFSDFPEHIDLRARKLMRDYDFGILTELEPGSTITYSGAASALTPGSGQADIRAITDPEGRPLFDGGRLWFTMTVRGRALPNPMQAVFSLNPSVFDLKFEGIIAFDLGDGLLRNEHASHLFFDEESQEWRGWTTGFSAYGGGGGEDEKTILAVSSSRDPRRGFSIMKAKPVGIDGAHEDAHCVYDTAVGKWRMLLCEKQEKYRAAIWESNSWDQGFERIAGPVPMDSTGTMIQQFGETRYALYGSADRTIYIATYPDLKPAGELNVYLPPWNDGNGTRVWPNVIPLPDGYPAPYLALMMDRVNFPGMPKRNWSYGALYLYHGFPREREAEE